MRNPLSLLLAALGLCLGLAAPAQAAGSPAGSSIVNQAGAGFTDPDAGPQSAVSNTVVTTITPVCAVSVTPKDQLAAYQPGGTLLYAFGVTNGGNGKYSFNLGVQNSFPAKFVRLYLDNAPTGVLGSNDVLLSSPEQVTLEADTKQPLLLEVGLPDKTSGELTSTLSASCPDGGPSDSGVGRARQGAKLELLKTFSSASAQPGDTVTVTLNVLNSGEFDALGVVVEDLFEKSLNATRKNFALVPGSARPIEGFASVPEGVRWTLPGLKSKASATLSFDLKVLEGAELGELTNSVTASGQDLNGAALPSGQAQAKITLRPPPQVNLGPVNNPRANPGGEGSANDRQSAAQVRLGEEVCLEHALENAGPDPDTLRVRLDTLLSGQAQVRFQTIGSGLPAFPVTLAPGQVYRFLACYSPSDSKPFEARLIAESERGAKANLTWDRVEKVIVPGVALGPAGNPEAPEDTEADTQTRPIAVLSQAICFEHTLKNTGNGPDSYTLAASVEQGAASVEFKVQQPIALEAGQSVNFTVCYTPTQGGPLAVRLTATSAYGPTNRTLDKVLEVAVPAIALGPVGNPEAPEGSDADLQRKQSALLNQPICFDHTVKNLGTLEDKIAVSGALSSGAGSVAFFNLDGTPLTFPVTLAPGASLTFRVCYTLTTAGTGASALEAVLTATSALGAKPNLTRDQVRQLFSGLPALEKSVNADAGKPVKQGDPLTYSLKITNPFPFALTGVQIQDALSASLDLSSAVLSNGGTLAGNVATWTLPTLAANSTVTLTVTAKVAKDAADGATVDNRFTFSSVEVPNPIPSNTVTNLIWGASLTLEKSADVGVVQIGGTLGWTLRVHNTSQSASLVNLVLTDTLPTGLSFVAGSATLGGQPLADPAVSGQTLSFTLPSGLAADAVVTLKFQTRLGVDAPETLVNSAVVRGNGQNQATSQLTAVASNVARSQAVRVNPRGFGAKGEILGRVYLDLDGDGQFSFANDIPQAGVRVLLADGRSALTDSEGRYHFQSLSEGTWGLRLDPNSVPYRPERDVLDGGKRGSRLVNVFALSVVDFPLEAPLGSVYACRVTTLRVGDTTLEKSLVRLSKDTYRVTLTLSAPSKLPALSFTDPLPPGATLLEGQNTFAGDVNAGEKRFVYTFRSSAEALSTMTDPELRWRYP